MVSQYQAELPKGILSCQQHLQKLFSSKPTQLWKTTVKVDLFPRESSMDFHMLYICFLKFFRCWPKGTYANPSFLIPWVGLHASVPWSNRWSAERLVAHPLLGFFHSIGERSCQQHHGTSMARVSNTQQPKKTYIFLIVPYFLSRNLFKICGFSVSQIICALPLAYNFFRSTLTILCLNLSGKISCVLDWNSLFKG